MRITIFIYNHGVFFSQLGQEVDCLTTICAKFKFYEKYVMLNGIHFRFIKVPTANAVKRYLRKYFIAKGNKSYH